MSDPGGESSGDDLPWSNAPEPPDSLGLARGTVELVEHRPEWSAAFEREDDRLREALGDDAVGVPDLETAREHRDRGTLRGLGYEYRETDDVPDRLFFARGPPARRTHYLSLTPMEGATIREQVAFRDALRADDALRDEYADLKRDLAATHGDERARYTAEKSSFVERVLEDAGPTDADQW